MKMREWRKRDPGNSTRNFKYGGQTARRSGVCYILVKRTGKWSGKRGWRSWKKLGMTNEFRGGRKTISGIVCAGINKRIV